MGGLTAAFSRLSRREQVLVGTMVLVLIVSVIGLSFFMLGSEVSDLETRVAEDRENLEKIYARSASFLEAQSATNAMRESAAKNVELNLKLAINEIAKRINFEARNRRGEKDGQKSLSDVLQFDQTQETFLSKKKKKKRKKAKQKGKKESDVGYYRRDQPITLSDSVEFKAIYELLEKIETSEQLMYVTDIEMTRDFQDGAVARKNATFVVSTFYYKGGRE